MHPIHGIALFGHSRRGGSAVPIIMVFGHEEVEQRALAAGADLFLTSVDLRRVGKLIAEFLRARGLSDKLDRRE